MAEYRLYQLDAADHIVAGYSVHCISDHAALAAARRLAERAIAVEVWQHTRYLGSVTALRTRSETTGRKLSENSGARLANGRRGRVPIERPADRPRLATTWKVSRQA
jgi:hypothetical protein